MWSSPAPSPKTPPKWWRPGLNGIGLRCKHRYFFFFLRFLLGPPGSGGACGLPSTRGGGVACAACGAAAGGMDPGVVSGACCEACHSSLSLRLLDLALRSSYFLGFFPPLFLATG